MGARTGGFGALAVVEAARLGQGGGIVAVLTGVGEESSSEMEEGKRVAATDMVGSRLSSTAAATAVELQRDPTAPWQGGGQGRGRGP